MLKYELSQKQIKHLRDSGRSVLVAIPIDLDEDPADWIAYVKNRLIEPDHPVGIVSAEPTSIWIYRTQGRPGGMVGVLGQIISSPKQCPRAGLLQLVDVVVAKISPFGELRPPSEKLRWPAKAYRDGVLIAGSDDAE